MKAITRACSPATLACWLWLALFLGFASSAQAQFTFKKMSLGAHLGFQNTFNQGGNPQAPKGSIEEIGYGVGPSYISLGIEWTYRFQEHLAAAAETHLSFNSCGKPSGEICEDGSVPIMIAAFTKLRIYMLTESFRPLVEVGIGYWQSVAFTKSAVTAFGPVASLGFDWFFGEDMLLGMRVQYGLELFVGPKSFIPFHQLMVNFTFATYI
jgi:hypothetical protein